MTQGSKRSLRAALFAAAAALGLWSAPAHAVVVEQGEIAFDGARSTIDLFFFQVLTDGDLTIVVSPLSVGPPLTGDENPELHVYLDDGTLSAANFLVGADDTLGLTPQVTFAFDPGSYVAVVGASDLQVGQFGPFRADGQSVAGFVYEIGFSAPSAGDPTLDCILEGNLDGTRDKTVRQGDTCHANVVSVVEPAGMGAAALVAILAAVGLRPSRYRGPGRAS